MTKELIDKIDVLTSQVYEESLNHRRYLHEHPELSWQEKNTSTYIQNFLKHENIAFKLYATHGIVATIACNNPTKRCIALRADMDALPIQEENDIAYKSNCDNIMHACGHDVHMACLMGAIKVINSLKEEIEGTIKFIFQPSEERQPSGAQKMIEEGVLENPKVDEIYGLHVTPELMCGQIGYKSGKFMASADEIYIDITGPGGHAAQAYQTVDTILVASHIIIALQQIVSRNANPIMPTVLSFGDIQGHGATNIIPKEVKIKGTLRTFDETWRKAIHIKITDIAQGIATSMGAICKVDIPAGLPFVMNNDVITLKSIRKISTFISPENLVEMPLRMGAEDFGYYSQLVPSCFYRLGTADSIEHQHKKLHTSTFSINENAILYGIKILVSSVF